MTFDRYEYTIGAHFVVALEYDDRTGLDDGECKALDAFLDALPGPGHWSWGDDESFALDDVSGLYGQCVRADYMVPAGGAA